MKARLTFVLIATPPLVASCVLTSACDFSASVRVQNESPLPVSVTVNGGSSKVFSAGETGSVYLRLNKKVRSVKLVMQSDPAEETDHLDAAGTVELQVSGPPLTVARVD